MHVRLAAVLAACFAACALALAADEGVTGTIVKVDKAKKTLTVKTDDGVKTYSASKETKFFGPRGGASENGIEDDIYREIARSPTSTDDVSKKMKLQKIFKCKNSLSAVLPRILQSFCI